MPCPHCDDTTWKTITIDGVSRVTRCDCWLQRRLDSLLKDARIPRGYAHCEFSNYSARTDSQKDALRKAMRLVERYPEQQPGLLFYGDTGVGKTHLAIALLKEAIRLKGVQAVFYEVRDLLKLVKDTYNTDVRATEMEVLRPVLEAELLILDDLGAEKKSPWVEETLGLVVNTRYSERRLTVFTTNLVDAENDEPNSFAFQLGLRIRSRLFEMCDWVRIDAHDTRETGTDATDEEIKSWHRASPAAPKNRMRTPLPPKSLGQARAQLKPRDRDGKTDLKWSGGKAGN